MNVEQRVQSIAQLVAIAIVAIGCYLVLRPFFSAILFAVVVCMSTWPLYLHLRRALGGNPSLAAFVMVSMLVLMLIAPLALLALSLMDNVTNIVATAKIFLEHGPIVAPAWLKRIPLIGEQLNQYWYLLTTGGREAITFFTELLGPTQKILLAIAKAISQSVLQMALAAFIGFFIYRDGEMLLKRLRTALLKLAGRLGEELLISIHLTVAGVVQGIFGAALAQSFIATIGFLIAGVPGAFLLGAATFFLSIIPIGPPLIWGGASIWLFNQGAYGWMLFMLAWGVIAISSIDNLVRPYLVTQSNHLSLLLNVLGLFGGILAFGFIGIFIGPPILVVAVTLVRAWTAHPLRSADSTRNKRSHPGADKGTKSS